MTQVQANGLALEVERRKPAGTPRGLPVLLVQGLGMQLTAWPDAFVEGLRSQGHEIILFDNRDIGLSSKRADWGKPNLLSGSLLYAMGLTPSAPYTLDDMCEDTVSLLDALLVSRVHLVGVSMGGMIGQLLAARHPDRIASFTCIMSASGSRTLPGPRWNARTALLSRPDNPRDPESVIDHYVKLFGVIGSPGFPTPAPERRELIARGVHRSNHPLGSLRQMAAIIASGDRSRLLKTITVPTTIVHGHDDPLVPVAAAHDLASKIPGARLHVIEGMGHDLPPGVIPTLIDEVLQTIARAGD